MVSLNVGRHPHHFVWRTRWALALVAAQLSCHDATGPAVPATVTVTMANSQIEAGDTARVKATALDAANRPLTGLAVVYSSSNAGIARIDTTGLVTALGAGAATITATIAGVSGTTTIAVVLTVATIKLTIPATNLDRGDSTRATVALTSPRGFAVSGRTVSYVSRNPAVAGVTDSGWVRTVSLGTAVIVATVDGKYDSVSMTVVARPASVRIDPPAPRINTAGSVQLTAVALDSAGQPIPGRTFTWTSANVQSVGVSPTGVASWVAPGRADITARTGSVTATVAVSAAGDYAIAGVHFTQGVQDAAGTIPMVTSGGSAAVLVLLTTQARVTATMTVRLRLLNADESLAYSTSADVSDAIDVTTSLAQPSARLLLPADQIRSGLRWQVVRDPDGSLPDDSSATDVFPRSGPAALAVAAVPPLNIRFVPITLAVHGNTTPSIAESDLGGYLQTVRSTLPVAQINAVIGAPQSTSASFGTAPTGGASSFWTQVLSELDLARVASSNDPTTHWYGVVSPPTGFNFTTFGGFGYVPSDPRETGRFTRTAVGVRTGWFNNPTQARDLVAHELGHNFGRLHAPCGGPSGLDPVFPRPDGTIGQLMHNVFSWNGSSAFPLSTIPASNGDLMSYCYPLWSSAYTYNGILNARTVVVSADARPVAATEVLAIQGIVRDNGSAPPALLPTVSLRGYPTRAGDTGDHRLQGFDERGRLLFDAFFTPTSVDHNPGVRLFTIAVPGDSAVGLTHIRVTGPTGTASLDAVTGPSVGAPAIQRSADGRVTVGCADALARLAVQDEASGQLLGVSAAGPISVLTNATRFSVSCSRGARPSRTSVTLR